jgi:D-alanyl-D-alanine carboxypeptidase (penicillin-binding protein 5/6)
MFTKKFLYLPLLLLFSQITLAAPDLVPAPPAIGAKAYLLLDYSSGRILAQKKASQRIEPASLTKLMTAYVVFYEMRNGSINNDERVKISKKAWKMQGSKMFIEVGKQIPVEKLIKGMIIQSGNDATIALAEHIAGSEEGFVTLMNRHAQKLGMKDTHFVNSTGWPEAEHYTTANDLAILTRAIIRDFPEHYELYKIKEYTFNNIRQFNRNRLLWRDDRVDGVKTGHTESAGFCLIASATKKEMRLISIVLGTNSEQARENSSRKLLNYGFRFYETFPLHASNEALTTMRIWKGEAKQIQLGLSEPLYVTVPRGSRNKVKANMKVDAMIVAPIKKGQALGSVHVMLGDEELVNHSLIALHDVEEGNLWRKLVDNVILMFN